MVCLQLVREIVNGIVGGVAAVRLKGLRGFFGFRGSQFIEATVANNIVGPKLKYILKFCMQVPGRIGVDGALAPLAFGGVRFVVY